MRVPRAVATNWRDKTEPAAKALGKVIVSGRESHVRRREFIGLVGGAAAWPAVAQAQTVRRVGIMLSSEQDDPEMRARSTAFETAMQALGWINGSNVQIDARWFGGSSERAEAHARDLVALGPDVIVVNATVGIQAVLKTTRSVPTVFVSVGNPVGSGFVPSMSRPGGNVTGFSAFEPEIAGRWMQVLKEIAPSTRHIRVLSYPGYEFLWEQAEAAAAAMSVAVSITPTHNTREIEQVIAETAGRSGGALIVLPAPVYASNRELVARLAASRGLPAVYPFRYYVAAGGLMSYGFDAVDLFKRASGYVDRILKGEKPGDLPVQAPTKFELVINMKAARALGLNVPPAMLAQADEVME